MPLRTCVFASRKSPTDGLPLEGCLQIISRCLAARPLRGKRRYARQLAHAILGFGACSMPVLPIAVPSEEIAEFCRRNEIRKLSFFGSVTTPRFRTESDVDMLVEFEADARPTLLTMARLERELSDLLQRKVDLRTANELSRYFRKEVFATAVPQYERS